MSLWQNYLEHPAAVPNVEQGQVIIKPVSHNDTTGSFSCLVPGPIEQAQAKADSGGV